MPERDDKLTPEIEITPEMIEAGAKELSSCPSAYFEPEGVAEAVYRAMRALERPEVRESRSTLRRA
jgi:hypothetical protein